MLTEYEFLYVREQRARFDIVASDEKEALMLAQQRLKELDLFSKDDESDDPGELFIEGATIV